MALGYAPLRTLEEEPCRSEPDERLEGAGTSLGPSDTDDSESFHATGSVP